MLEIGQQIKSIREAREITGKELALQIGLSQSQMSRLEQGQRRIDTEILAKIADALKVSPAEFFAAETHTQLGMSTSSPPGSNLGATKALSARRERELELSHLYKEIGTKIRSERRQRHLTSQDLARKTGQTHAFIVAVEEGRRSGLDEGFISKVCKLLGIELNALLLMHEQVIKSLKQRLHQYDRDLSAMELSNEGDRPSGTPILVGDESVYPADFDENGFPVAAVEGFVSIPGLTAGSSFAVRVRRSEMLNSSSPSFAEGDLVSFSTKRMARSGEFAFIHYHEDEKLSGELSAESNLAADKSSSAKMDNEKASNTIFRQFFQDSPGVIRLHALTPEVPPILLKSESLINAWPLVNHISQFC